MSRLQRCSIISALMVGSMVFAHTLPPTPRITWLGEQDLRSANVVSQAVAAKFAEDVHLVIVPVPDQDPDLPAETTFGFDPVKAAMSADGSSRRSIFIAIDTFNGSPESLAEHLVGRNGSTLPPGTGLDPGSPLTRQRVRTRILSVIKEHPSVGGIVLTGLGYSGIGVGFSDEDLAQFRTVQESHLTREQKDALALLPERDAWVRMFPGRWAQWRSDNLTGFLAGLYREIQQKCPDLVVAVAIPISNGDVGWNTSVALMNRGQDALKWKQQGIIDALLLIPDQGQLSINETLLKSARSAPGSPAVWSCQAPPVP